jgi:hypothetical protein
MALRPEDARRSPPTMMSILAVDALYYHAARKACSQAVACMRRIERAEGRIATLQRKIDALTHTPEGEGDSQLALRNYTALEPLCFQMEGAEYQLGEAYGPMLQNVALVHILSASSAEAHINIKAQGRLHGRDWDAFERLSVDAKWLFLPKLLGLPGFESGRQPFQGFDSLLRIRNRLVHYHIHAEPWDSPGVPEFLTALGLNVELGERSLEAVRGMVSELAHQFREEAPSWLTRPKANFFEVTLDE